MLKFLQNKASNRLTIKPLVNYQPSLIYGHTTESPLQFINTHTIFFHNQNSSEPLLSKLPPAQSSGSKPPKKQNLLNEESFNFTSQYRKSGSRERVSLTHNKIESQAQGDFNITRGEFSNFLDKHKHYASLGTIHKQNRLYNTQSMHKFTWNKSNNTVNKGSPTSSIARQKTSLPSETIDHERGLRTHTKQSSLWMTRSNSVSIFEEVAKKSEIKLRRDEFITSMKKETKQRLEKKYENFGLPRLGVGHELYLLEKKKAMKDVPQSELEELNCDINKFEQSLYYKFK